MYENNLLYFFTNSFINMFTSVAPRTLRIQKPIEFNCQWFDKITSLWPKRT